MMGESGQILGWKAESTGSVPMPSLFSEGKCRLTSPCLSFSVWKIRYWYISERVWKHL